MAGLRRSQTELEGVEASGEMCYVERPTTLAHKFLLQSSGAGAAGRALRAIPKLPDIDLKFVDGAAQRIAVHAQYAGGAALVALVFQKHGEDE